MKWTLCILVGTLVLAPLVAQSQKMEMLQVDNIRHVDDKSPTTWGMSGMEMIPLTQSNGTFTPIMRSFRMDARTVEILCRTQAPPLSGNDIRTVVENGRHYVVVRRYMLAEVFPQDARAAKSSIGDLTAKWAHAVRVVLPQVAPMGNRFGI